MTSNEIIKAFTEMLKDQFDHYGVDYTAYAIVDKVLEKWEAKQYDQGKAPSL